MGPSERHFHSEPGILPICVQMVSLAATQDQNVRFKKPAQNEHFYRLSCRALYFGSGTRSRTLNLQRGDSFQNGTVSTPNRVGRQSVCEVGFIRRLIVGEQP
jgi:hypothetical protein